jgi:hypothetical protein
MRRKLPQSPSRKHSLLVADFTNSIDPQETSRPRRKSCIPPSLKVQTARLLSGIV